MSPRILRFVLAGLAMLAPGAIRVCAAPLPPKATSKAVRIDCPAAGGQALRILSVRLPGSSSSRVILCPVASARLASDRFPLGILTRSIASFAAAAFLQPGDSSGANGPPRLPAFSGRFWIGGQINVIAQGHGDFHALYSGPNSFSHEAEAAVTSIEDLFSGIRVSRDFDILLDAEDVRGQGLSNVVGLAGFTDLDAQKTPAAGTQPRTYVSRVLLHYSFPIGGNDRRNDPSYLELNSRLSARRLELYFGKFSLADFFDQNDYAGNDHSQFLNWTTDQNGAWDYAANTAGYTYGAYLEFDDGAWTVRYAEALMPRVPNGLHLSLHLGRTRAENAEVDWAYSPRTSGAVRLLGYVDQATMGSFSDALSAWRAGSTPVPNTADVRKPGRHEYGYELNWQQGLPSRFGLFARAGWNNGKYESFAYTEVNNTIEAGMEVPGHLWKRSKDHAGIAFVSNGISLLHQEYLAAGGLGFQLGDGGLTYSREQILESYYNLPIPHGLSFAPDVQFVVNPGYNQVRGPVTVFSLRLNWNFGFHRIG